MNAASTAAIQRTLNTEPTFVNGALRPCCGSGPPYANYFSPLNPATSLTQTFVNNQYSPDVLTNPNKTDNLYWNPNRHSASGLGDIAFRVKSRIYRNERVTLSFLTDLRLPTGDALNFLGSGTVGWRPFIALSAVTGLLTPHFNVGYQWNGQSLMAGDIVRGTKGSLSGNAFFSAGTDVRLTPRATLAVDYIGQELFHAPRITVNTITSQTALVNTGQIGSFPSISPETNQIYNQSNLAVGGKVRLLHKLVFSSNILIALNDGGVRERVVPLLGLGYTF